jgi:hypothetical protein
LIGLLHGQIQFFVKVEVGMKLFPFVAIKTVHWNNSPIPQFYHPLGKVITDNQPNNQLWMTPASYLMGIVSLFPLANKIEGKKAYVVTPYKFEIYG